MNLCSHGLGSDCRRKLYVGLVEAAGNVGMIVRGRLRMVLGMTIFGGWFWELGVGMITGFGIVLMVNLGLVFRLRVELRVGGSYRALAKGNFFASAIFGFLFE